MKILGMGNALVDIMTQLYDDSILQRFEFPKGSMTLVDNEMSGFLYNETIGLLKHMASGGSAANTIHGLSHLGVETTFMGKIGNDELGRFFKSDMEINGISTILFKSDTGTGRVLAMVSPDTERTMATYLGAAIELDAKDLSEEIFRGQDFFYIEGYLVQNKELIQNALSLAKISGARTCLDLASYNIVLENIDFLKSILREYVDIVFANEEEARALTGKAPEGALKDLSELCELAVVKIGSNGSLIKAGSEVIVVPAHQAKSIDSTGAGDLYAAGFLYGIGKNHSYRTAGEIGSLLAARVIEGIGAKMEEPAWDILRQEIEAIELKQAM